MSAKPRPLPGHIHHSTSSDKSVLTYTLYKMADEQHKIDNAARFNQASAGAAQNDNDLVFFLLDRYDMDGDDFRGTDYDTPPKLCTFIEDLKKNAGGARIIDIRIGPFRLGAKLEGTKITGELGVSVPFYGHVVIARFSGDLAQGPVEVKIGTYGFASGKATLFLKGPSVWIALDVSLLNKQYSVTAKLFDL